MSLRRRPIARSLFAGLLLATTALGNASAQTGLGVPPATIDDCPVSHPVKGNASGRQQERPEDPIYHVPGGRWYDVTDPEECFATAADAEAAGYRAPRR